MKLKKIASLMLAGIMAVSMLAACGEGKKDDSSSSSSEAPVISDVVAYANDALSGAEKNTIKFNASTNLDTALKAVAEDKSKFSSKDIEALDTVFAAANDDDLEDALEGKLDGFFVSNDTKSSFNKLPADKKSQKMVSVYEISGSLDEAAAVKEIVKAWNSNSKTWTAIDKTNYPSSLVADGYDCTYSAEISAVKVASADNSAKDAWVVAIVVTQNVTEVGNVK